jgi:hypothetical protein
MPTGRLSRTWASLLLALLAPAGCVADAEGIEGPGGEAVSTEDAGKAPVNLGAPLGATDADSGKASTGTDSGTGAETGTGTATETGTGTGTGTGAGSSVDAGTGDAGGSGASVESSIAAIALANVGEGACSQNSAGGSTFETSCTGNNGSPEYWCADFAQWVWSQAGVDTSGLDAAAGSFYLYGQNNGTLHTTPSLGDAVVFNYSGDGVAEHVAIIVQLNADGTIETVSGDWNGQNGTEAQFASTSQVVHNTPAYPGTDGSTPAIMGMTISGFVSPAGTSGSAGGSADAGSGGCYSDTLGKEMPNNACVQSASDDDWYQCDNGEWTDRATDPATCNGTYPL